MKQFFLNSSLILLGLVLISSCGKDDPAPVVNTVTLTASSLSGANESTPNASTATGSATVSYNKDTKILTATVTHTIAAPTAAHIHKGAVGISGPVVFNFGTATSPIAYTSAALTQGQEDSLLLNLMYVNVHSAAFPSGEIRGQLIKQ